MEFYHGYHNAVDRAVAESGCSTLLSLHTFSPIYEGRVREMEIGVLFDREDERAEALRDELAGYGFRVAMNQPYSGKNGMIYSVDQHARRHQRIALELEIRQDLCVKPAFRQRLIQPLTTFFR